MFFSFRQRSRGLLYGEGKVIQLGKTIAFVEAQLTDANNTVVARATAKSRMIRIDFVKGVASDAAS
jgi:acyl-coenzyme A thioesterase PaaI-like protein